MKYFIFGDVHGYFDKLQGALSSAGYDPSDKNSIIVSLGDLFDRGPQSKECLDWIMNIPKERRILIRGNHEDLLEDVMIRRGLLSHDIHNGTDITVGDLTTDTEFTNEQKIIEGLRKNKPLMDYLDECQSFVETKTAVFVHGWIPCRHESIAGKQEIYEPVDDWRSGNWESARWYNGMDAWRNGVNASPKTVYCGHWHASWGHCRIAKTSVEWPNRYSTNPDHRKADFSPFVGDGIVALDGCVAFSGIVNVWVLEEN